MQKQVIEYSSPLDALVALAKQLNAYEIRYKLDSAEFFTLYQNGQTEDTEDLIDWAGNYQHYLALHHELTEKLKDVV